MTCLAPKKKTCVRASQLTLTPSGRHFMAARRKTNCYSKSFISPYKQRFFGGKPCWECVCWQEAVQVSVHQSRQRETPQSVLGTCVLLPQPHGTDAGRWHGFFPTKTLHHSGSRTHPRGEGTAADWLGRPAPSLRVTSSAGHETEEKESGEMWRRTGVCTQHLKTGRESRNALIYFLKY